MRFRALIAGLIVGAMYVGAAVLTARSGTPVVPLFDGLQPPAPYRWVKPPPAFAAENVAPVPASKIVAFDKGASLSDALATDDGQAQIILPIGSFTGEGKGIRLTITPLEPTIVGPPPRGLRFDGNAYTFDALLEDTGEPVAPAQPATVVLRFPARANQLLRWSGTKWVRLPMVTSVAATLQIYTNTTELGTFVAAGRPLHQKKKPTPWLRWLIYGLVALAVVSVTLLAWLRARRKNPKGSRSKP